MGMDDNKKNMEKAVLIGMGSAQWWTILGAAIFTAGLILLALAYSTIQIIATVPSNILGSAPAVGFQDYSIAILVTAFGFVLMLFGKFKIAKLNWIK